MSSVRLMAAAALALLAAGGLGWLYLHPSSSPGGTGRFEVAVVGPGGQPVFNGTVQARNATALSVLEAAGAAAHFAVATTVYQGYGADPCSGTYVTSIAGHAASGPSGWVYRVRLPGGPWRSPARSATCEGLTAGEQVQWRWTDGGEG